MIKIPDAVKEIVEKSQLIKFGLAYRLLNLTQIATFIQPHVEARTKKQTKTAAITMALSRLQQTLSHLSPKLDNFKLENLAIRKNLAIITFCKNQKTQKVLPKLQKYTTTITQGTDEITITIPQSELETVMQILEKEDQTPKSSEENVTSITIKFDVKYNSQPGFLYLILQQLSFQHINIIEITSTHTELIIYLRERDAKLAFDTLITSF